MNASQKYGVVRAIAFILKLLAWAALVVGVIAAVVSLTASNAPGALKVLSSLGLIIGPVVGIIWFVQLFAFGSILTLLVDIEENTRQLAAEPSPEH
jgi:hypothetical protein